MPMNHRSRHTHRWSDSRNWTFDPTNDAYQSLAANDTQTITVDYGVTDSKGAIAQLL